MVMLNSNKYIVEIWRYVSILYFPLNAIIFSSHSDRMLAQVKNECATLSACVNSFSPSKLLWKLYVTVASLFGWMLCDSLIRKNKVFGCDRGIDASLFY